MPLPIVKKQDWAFGQISLRKRKLPKLTQTLAAGHKGQQIIFAQIVWLQPNLPKLFGYN